MCNNRCKQCAKYPQQDDAANGIVYCKCDESCCGDVSIPAIHAARKFASELIESALQLIKNMPHTPGDSLYEEFVCKYRSFRLTVDFLELLVPLENNPSFSRYPVNYLRMYQEGEELRTIMENLQKEKTK